MNFMVNERLFKAVESGDVENVKQALEEEKINAATYYGAKSIVLAAKQGNREILEMILKNGEKINRESFWRRAAFSALRAAKNAENTEIWELLLEYGAGVDKKMLNSALANNACENPPKMKFCCEDGIYIPEKYSKDYIREKNFVQYAKEGEIKKIKNLLEEGVSENALSAAFDAALKQNNWDVAVILSEYCYDKEVEIYTECIKKLFLKSSYTGDTEKVKLYLEKLIENEEGVSENALSAAFDAALKQNSWEVASIISEYCYDKEVEIYTECIKKLFLKSSYTGDTEKVKLYLEKLIENAVGVLTDETGKSTLEIALENNPADIIILLSNYGFHENALLHAYKCLTNK